MTGRVATAKPYNGPLITQQCQEAGKSFTEIGSHLLIQGDIDLSDPRLKSQVFRKDGSVTTTAKGFGRQITSLRSEIESLDLEKSQDRKIKSLLAAQKKIFGDAPQRIDPGGPKAAQTAICLENIAMQIPAEGNQELITNCLAFAAKTSDRCVYAQRHKEFDGLVAPLARKYQTTIPDMAKELIRAGRIPDDDPRAQTPSGREPEANRLMTAPFLDFIKTSVASSLSKAKRIENPVFGRRAIVDDVVNLKMLPGSSSPRASDERACAFMMTIAQINERMAMNAHISGARPQTVQSMLDTADSASRRAMVYEVRAGMRDHQNSIHVVKKAARDARH